MVLSQRVTYEAGVKLADTETLGHQGAVLVSQIAVCCSELVPFWGVDEEYGRGFPQDQVVPGGMFAHQPAEGGYVPVDIRHDPLQDGPQEGIFQFFEHGGENTYGEITDLLQLFRVRN